MRATHCGHAVAQFVRGDEGTSYCPACENAQRLGGVQRDEIRNILADIYLPEGIELWLAHADRQGWSYEEALQRALNAAEGNFS